MALVSYSFTVISCGRWSRPVLREPDEQRLVADGILTNDTLETARTGNRFLENDLALAWLGAQAEIACELAYRRYTPASAGSAPRRRWPTTASSRAGSSLRARPARVSDPRCGKPLSLSGHRRFHIWRAYRNPVNWQNESDH